MEGNQLKAISFLFKFLLLHQLVYCIYNHKFEAEATQAELYHRMSKIEDRNRQHEKEISILKMRKVEDRNEIHLLRERVALLESSTFSNSSSGEKFRRRVKRPVRLLPINVLRPSKKGENEAEEDVPSTKRFYGPPTSCDDLKKLGYTLNGYYLIKRKEKSNAYRIHVTYCKFYQPPGTNLDVEELIGSADVRSKSVHFFAQRNSSFVAPTAVIPFDVVPLNEGNAFKISSGVFTVPVPGLYHFHFTALKTNAANFLDIFLQVNDKTICTAFTDQQGPSKLTSVVFLSASLRLAAGDRVKLLNNKGFNGIGVLFDNGNHHTSFTGWLMEEDLV